MMNRTFALVVAFALTSITFTPAVSAATPQERVEVVYRDLDLATEQGRDELAKRIDRVAKQFCGFAEHQTGTRTRSSEMRQCYGETVEALEERFAEIVENAQRGG